MEQGLHDPHRDRSVDDPSREMIEDRAIATLGRRHSRLVNVVTIVASLIAFPVGFGAYCLVRDLQYAAFHVQFLALSAMGGAVPGIITLMVGSHWLKRASVKVLAPRWLDEFARQGCDRTLLQTIISPW